MYSHIMIGSNDIARSKKFYDALFTAMALSPPPRTPEAGSPTRTMAAVHGEQADRRQPAKSRSGKRRLGVRR